MRRAMSNMIESLKNQLTMSKHCKKFSFRLEMDHTETVSR